MRNKAGCGAVVGNSKFSSKALVCESCSRRWLAFVSASVSDCSYWVLRVIRESVGDGMWVDRGITLEFLIIEFHSIIFRFARTGIDNAPLWEMERRNDAITLSKIDTA